MPNWTAPISAAPCCTARISGTRNLSMRRSGAQSSQVSISTNSRCHQKLWRAVSLTDIFLPVSGGEIRRPQIEARRASAMDSVRRCTGCAGRSGRRGFAAVARSSGRQTTVRLVCPQRDLCRPGFFRRPASGCEVRWRRSSRRQFLERRSAWRVASRDKARTCQVRQGQSTRTTSNLTSRIGPGAGPDRRRCDRRTIFGRGVLDGKGLPRWDYGQQRRRPTAAVLIDLG